MGDEWPKVALVDVAERFRARAVSHRGDHGGDRTVLAKRRDEASPTDLLREGRRDTRLADSLSNAPPRGHARPGPDADPGAGRAEQEGKVFDQ